jgi:hypothetical protein
MLGFMMKSPHRLKLAIVFGAFLALGVAIGLGAGF